MATKTKTKPEYWTPQRRAAHARRMKAVWAKRRARQQEQTAPQPALAPRWLVRVLSTQDGLQLDTCEIDSWGQLVDLLTDGYPGIPIEEVTITKNPARG